MPSGEELNFEVIREPWNFYELEGGVILKTRFILKRVFRLKKDDGKIGYNMGSQNMTIVTHIPNDMKGKKAKKILPLKELQTTVLRDNIRFDTLREEWNEYVPEDGSNIRIKLTLMNVASTSQFDQEGDPIYIANTSTMTNIRLPKQYSDLES